MQNLIVLFLAMAASGTIGFLLARERYGSQRDSQLHILGSEIRRMRRRAQSAEAASNRMKVERDRIQRTRALR